MISQYGLQIAKYLFPFITLPYLTRVLGPDVYAIRAYVIAVMTFMQVFLDYGFTMFGTKIIAENSDDLNKVGTNTSCIVQLRFILCIIGALILASITPFLPIMASNSFYVVLAYIGVCLKATLPDFVFQGLEDMGIITQRFIGSQTVSTVLIFVLIRDASDLLLIPVLEGLAALIAFVWSWDNIFRIRKIRLVKVPFSVAFQAFKESSIFFLSNAATTVFNAFTTLMIGIYATNHAEISYWSIAITAITAVQSLYNPIINSLYPHIVKSRDTKLLKKFLLVGMIIVSIGTVLFVFCSRLIMLVLGGPEYVDGSYVLSLLAPVLWFSFPAMLIGFPYLAAIGKVKELTISSVTAAIFHIAGLIILGVGGGFTIVSVAILRCCTEAIMLLMRTIFIRRTRRAQ